jgi:hypothetical protein
MIKELATWWEQLSESEKQAYVKKHPKSGYAQKYGAPRPTDPKDLVKENSMAIRETSSPADDKRVYRMLESDRKKLVKGFLALAKEFKNYNAEVKKEMARIDKEGGSMSDKQRLRDSLLPIPVMSGNTLALETEF